MGIYRVYIRAKNTNELWIKLSLYLRLAVSSTFLEYLARMLTPQVWFSCFNKYFKNIDYCGIYFACHMTVSAVELPETGQSLCCSILNFLQNQNGSERRIGKDLALNILTYY